jgi:hypothetical protein
VPKPFVKAKALSGRILGVARKGCQSNARLK